MRVTLGADGLLPVFIYGIDELRTLSVVRRGRDLEAALVTRSYEARTAVKSAPADPVAAAERASFDDTVRRWAALLERPAETRTTALLR